jgi:hypothetical protein
MGCGPSVLRWTATAALLLMGVLARIPIQSLVEWGPTEALEQHHRHRRAVSEQERARSATRSAAPTVSVGSTGTPNGETHAGVHGISGAIQTLAAAATTAEADAALDTLAELVEATAVTRADSDPHPERALQLRRDIMGACQQLAAASEVLDVTGRAFTSLLAALGTRWAVADLGVRRRVIFQVPGAAAHGGRASWEGAGAGAGGRRAL